jgi:RNA polymerase sigma-70 factor (ECF subfamily)
MKTAIDFKAMYNENYITLLNYINSKIHNLNCAEEIVNDVFVKIYKNIDSFNPALSSPKTWMYTITNNCIIDFYRQNKNTDLKVNVSNFVDDEDKEFFQFVDESKSSLTDFNVDNLELSESLLNAFRGLKANYRKIAVLFFLRQKQYDEIAVICNVPMGTVKGMIARSREMLQSELKNEYSNLFA